MAYVTTYTVNFTNQLDEEVEVLIQEKDGTATDPINYECEQLEITTNGEEQSPFDCILAKQLTLVFHVPEGDTAMDWSTLLASNYDDWKIIVTINGTRKEFEGFLVPEEGSVPFHDKPYSITLKATTGVALLKGVALTDVNDDNFNSEHTLIEYIAGALKKTGLALPIRCYCSYFNIAILEKGASLDNDLFGQIYLDYRTFLKDATTFVSCYDALKIILDKFCTLEQWNGMWQIACIGDKQYLRGDGFYVDYDENGENPAGAQVTENYAEVGTYKPLFAIDNDQVRSGKFSIKSARTEYEYKVWPEIPKNNVFERGTQIGSGTNPDSTTYKTFSINDWNQGEVDLFDLPNPAMSSVSQKFYRKSSYNSFGIEVGREIIGETISTDDLNHSFWLRSEGIPINKGDKIKFSLQKKFDNNFGSGGSTVFTIPAVLYIATASTAYYLDNNIDGHQTGVGRWRVAVNLAGQLIVEYPPGSNTTEYASLEVTSEAAPVDGTFYIALSVDGPIANTGANQYYKDITLEYLPFVAGGYIPVKGDYFERTQSIALPDIIEEDVKISDSPKKVFQGSLLFDNGGSSLILTQQNWYRYNTIASPNPGPELLGFKDLLNLARFNFQWRRMQSVSGTFRGLSYEPQNDIDNKLPISFHIRYRLTDLPDERYFVLVAPLKQDLIKGTTNVTFLEVSKDGDDGTQLQTAQELKYIF